MGTSPDPPASHTSAPLDDPSQDRLDSWKEIAAFLQRDVRTVQRWEKQAGLPIHRHAHSRLRTAYAYRSELETWWRTYPPSVEAGGVGTDVIADRRDTRRAPKVAAGIVVALAAAIVLGLLVNRPEEPAETAHPAADRVQIHVLLADFDNQTGEAKLDLLAKEEVVRELTRHKALRIVPPGRMAKLLRLTKRDNTARVTREVGRELALRDGSVRFVVAGGIRRIKQSYYVALELIDSEEGGVHASDERRLTNEEELAAAVRQEAGEFARRLVEAGAAPTPAVRRLEEVTTPSLTAARLYSEAMRAGSQGQWSASELLARQALAADPEFASGYAWLAWTLRNQGHPVDECLPLARRAVALSTGGTERENYFISGTFFEMQEDLTKALGAYEALLRIEPRDTRTLDLLVSSYSRVGRFGTAVEHAIARADMKQDDFYGNVRAAHALITWQSDRRRADPFVRRAQSLLTTRVGVERPRWKAWLRVLPVFERWLADDPQAARELLAPLDAALSQSTGRERDALATAVGSSYLALGMLRSAERAFRFASAPVRQINLAMLGLTLDDEARAREALREIRSAGLERPAFFAAVGLLTEARAGLASSFGSDHREGIQALTRGIMVQRRGHAEAAVKWLNRGVDLLRASGEPEYFHGVGKLARILVARGDEPRAVRLLEDAVQQRRRTYGSIWWAGGPWTRTAVQLLALYERRAQRAEAEQLRTTLRTIMKYADNDHPLVNALGGR